MKDFIKTNYFLNKKFKYLFHQPVVSESNITRTNIISYHCVLDSVWLLFWVIFDGNKKKQDYFLVRLLANSAGA